MNTKPQIITIKVPNIKLAVFVGVLALIVNLAVGLTAVYYVSHPAQPSVHAVKLRSISIEIDGTNYTGASDVIFFKSHYQD